MTTHHTDDERLVWLAEIAWLAAQEGRVNPDDETESDDEG